MKTVRSATIIALWMLRASIAPAQSTSPVVELPTQIVTATRGAQPVETLPVRVDRWGAAELQSPSTLALDDVLRGSAAFSLFRRSSSVTAHPTAQGVSLRGIGPSGASRSLVLLDGVPLNDPFGGWVAWNKVPRLTLGSAEMVRGGGSGVWGGSALGGVVQLFTQAPQQGDTMVAADAGDFGTARVEAATSLPAGRAGVLRVGARRFETDGVFQYRPSDRGAIDRRFDSRHTLVHADLTIPLASGWLLSAGGRAFDEKRGNGTPFQRNASRESSGMVRLSRKESTGTAVEVSAYVQNQTFESGFSSVDATRSSETPALDQYDVPATAFGVAATATWRHAPAASTTIGADLRVVRGETRERFFFDGATFLRRRVAGGESIATGAFAAHRHELASNLQLQFSARADQWRIADGHRREEILATGVSVRDDRFDDREGIEFSPTVGLVWSASEATRVRASVFRAFRVPTLNELFRPFRVGNVATEANPALGLERLVGAELGAEWTRGSWQASAGGFAVQLDDAVANVTLSASPSLIQRQRRNLERVGIAGYEATVSWRPRHRFTIMLDYLYNYTQVERATIAPELEGRRLPQVPRHTATARVVWAFRENWRLSADARAVSSQYEDDANQMSLASAVVADLALNTDLGSGWSLSVVVENVGDRAVETAMAADGRVSVGPPRLARVSVARGF